MTLLILALIFMTLTFMVAEPLGFLAFDLVAATFLIACTRVAAHDPLSRALRQPLAQWIGSRSYGLYLYHYPIFIALEALRVPGSLGNFAAVAVLKLVLSLALTELAWRWVEQPVLTLKARFAAKASPAVGDSRGKAGSGKVASGAIE